MELERAEAHCSAIESVGTLIRSLALSLDLANVRSDRRDIAHGLPCGARRYVSSLGSARALNDDNKGGRRFKRAELALCFKAG